MKKIALCIGLLFACSQIGNAQVHFGIKGGINYNSNSIENVTSDVLSGVENKSGFHGGIWLRFKIPVIGFYVRPELVFTQLKNNVVYKRAGSSATASGDPTSYNFKKIDIPVLFGKKIFGFGNVFIGPSFQYVLNSDFGFSDLQDVKSEGFTTGLQFGAGVELGKLGIDVRCERSFSGFETSFIDSGSEINFDTRVNQIIIGISYRL